MNWLRKLLNLRSDPPVANVTDDELIEAKALRSEQKRHVDFITNHIADVTARVRADAQRAEERLSRR